MTLRGTDNKPGQSTPANTAGQETPRPTTMGQSFERAGIAPNAAARADSTGRTGQFSFRDVGRLSNIPMGRNPASEVLTKLQKALQPVYENVAKQYEVTLIPIDQSQTSDLVVSVLVVCARETSAKDLGVAYHVLVLEASVESIPPRFEQVNGQNVEIVRTVGDAVDNRMAQIVKEAVARHFPQTSLWNAEATVVPREFNVTDENQVYSLAQNSVYAAAFELEQRRPDFQDMNLANASRDENLTVRVAFPKTEIQNAVGQPIRSDITIDLTAVAAASQMNQQLVESSVLVTRVGGYLDLVYNPAVAPGTQFGAFAQPQQNQYQRYATRFVMTNMENLKLPTLPGQLMALVTALALRDNNTWVQAFRPTMNNAGELDIHDIGAVGIEANFENNPNGIGSKIDTKSDSFKPDSLMKLITATFSQGLILSLDVAESGPDTWCNGVFAAAAEGNLKANEAILEAANELTNGVFARHFPQNEQVVIDEANRVHLGYYIDRQGIKRDLREIDYLAVLNYIGERDPEAVRDWSDSFNRTGFPLNMRLAGRRRILQGIEPNIVITGFARRVTFIPKFLDALALACQECGLDVRSITPYADAGSYERANAQFASATMMTGTSSGLFNRGIGGYKSSPMGADRTFSGRWYA